MRLVLILLVVVLGAAAGISITWLAVGPAAGVLTQTFHGWEFAPRVGSPEIDPYTRARLFSEGELPLAAGEGYTLRARADADGAPLDRRCRYQLSSPFPAARYWTLTLTDSTGRNLPNLAERAGFTSADIIRLQGNAFTIEIGPDPLPGNWLPTGRKGASGSVDTFALVLRFYETPLSATATRLDPRQMPVLRKLECPA